MDIKFNPETPEGQQQLQTEGVAVISAIPYGGTHSSSDDKASDSDPNEDGFIDGLVKAFGLAQ